MKTRSSKNLPVVVIACKVFENLIEQLLPEGLVKQITFLDYGLHEVPKELTSVLQDSIDELDEPSLVVLGYGLCGNGLDGIRAGKQTLLVARTDDCIAMFLGSYKDYLEEFQKEPGTYYLTKGWLESGSNPLKEHQTYVKKYGAEKAQWFMDYQYQNYKRLVLVAHTQADLEKYRPQAKEVAQYCEQWGMRYEEILGSDNYLRRLVKAATNLENTDNDFILVPPGGELAQGLFRR